MGTEFVRGRVCQGPSLLGAEMSSLLEDNACQCTTIVILDSLVIWLSPFLQKNSRHKISRKCINFHVIMIMLRFCKLSYFGKLHI